MSIVHDLTQSAVRFVLGGTIVSVFAVIGDSFRPKTFAGIFGAAPSVALASLGLSFAQHGAGFASTEGRAMLAGALALAGYSVACARALDNESARRIWLRVTVLWAVWFAIAFFIWGTAIRSRT